jgi:hypothetical protein
MGFDALQNLCTPGGAHKTESDLLIGANRRVRPSRGQVGRFVQETPYPRDSIADAYFLDANILFSAAKSAGAIRRLVEEIQIRSHGCLADEYVIAEARRNLEQKFSGALSDFENLLRGISRLVSPPALPSPNLTLVLPEKDRPVLASAIQHRCQALLTGDKTHFGRLYGQTIAGVSIHSPQGIAEVLASETEAKGKQGQQEGESDMKLAGQLAVYTREHLRACGRLSGTRSLRACGTEPFAGNFET